MGDAAEKQLEEISWPDVIESAKEKFLEVKPHGMEFSAERSFAIQQLKANDYLLSAAKKNKASLQAAMLNVAAIGLSLNPAKKQAYLVPRAGKVCLDPSYMGLCDIATMSGSIKWVQAKLVCANDIFEDNGPGEKPTHTYKPFAKKEDRGEFVGVYCVAKTVDGDYLTEVMPSEDVNGIMARSESAKKNYGPWITDFQEMAKKSVVRRAYKMWPKTESMDRMALAVQLSNENEGFEQIKTSPALGQFNEDQKGLFDQLITNTDPLGMYVFQKTLDDESTFANLYHSFEKGQKGKYQRIVDDLLKRGFESFMDYVQIFDDACDAEDDMAIKENMTDLSADAMTLIKEKLAPQSARFIESIKD